MSSTLMCNSVSTLYMNKHLMEMYNLEILVMIMCILVDARGKQCNLDKEKK
jgi:hypothetical protein